MDRKTAYFIRFSKFSSALFVCCALLRGILPVYADDAADTATADSAAVLNAGSASVPAPGPGTAETPGKDDAKKDDKTVITIDNARSTMYEKDKDTGDDCIVLEGDVRISVAKGSTKTTISAQKVRYDRVTQMMYAEGGVSMEQTGSASGNDNATASSLMFNTATLEGVFDDGRIVQTQSDAINLPSGSTLIVASDMFGRSESNTISFKDGRLTFCDDPDPHWHIDASRIWLLPGGEFAFFNALLYVGVVPVLYLPAFYYPKDELIFNPVFGYDSRTGYYVQTTTYLYGRKPLDTTTTTTSSDDDDDDDESSTSESLKALFNFIRPSTLKQQRLEGLVLHNLDEDYTGSTTNYFKIFGDWYSNLGAMAGFGGVFKPNDYITDLEVTGMLGFSNTVFLDSSTGLYIPYASSGKKYQDSSNFLGVKLPFRYGTNFKFTLSKPFTLTLSLPLYSDPYFTDDFTEDRTETMDWISYLTESSSDDDDDDTTVVSSFTWSLSSSYSFPLSTSIKPYISTLSGSLSSTVVFSALTNSELSSTDSLSTYSPEREFYYPSTITPATASVTWSGTLFSYSSSPSSAAAAKQNQLLASQLVVPDDLKPSDDAAAAEAQQESAQPEKPAPGENSGDTEQEGGGADTAGQQPDASSSGNTQGDASGDSASGKDKNGNAAGTLPELTAASPTATSVSGIDYKLTYSIKPTFTSQLAYSSTNLDEPEDFDLSKLKSSMFTLKVPVVFDSVAGYGGSFFNIDNSLTFNPVLQEHPYISTDTTNGGYTSTSAASLKETDYTATKFEITNSNSISIKPFYYVDAFKNTGITYKSTIKMLRTKFIGDADNPEWEYLTTDWNDDDSITTHELDFTFAATEGPDDLFGQSLALTMTLPPQVDEYDATLTLTFPYTTLTFASGVEQTSSTDDTWEKLPFKQALSVSLFNSNLKFTESYNYDLEEEHNDALKLALTLGGLQAAYTMSYTNGYDWDDDDGWVERDSEEFLPYSLSLAYAPTTKTWYTWKNRVSTAPGLSTSIVADLLRPTNSYFIFTPSLSFKINDFVTFTFSSTSKNSVLYRYVQTALGEEGRIPGEDNPFIDLINSFRFDDESLRKASGFKLKSLNFTLTHDLHDWTFKTTYKLSPRLVTSSSSTYYDFNPYVTVSIIWNPMESMKTQVVDDYGTFELNP